MEETEAMTAFARRTVDDGNVVFSDDDSVFAFLFGVLRNDLLFEYIHDEVMMIVCDVPVADGACVCCCRYWAGFRTGAE